MSEQPELGPLHARKAKRAAREPLLVARHEEDERVEGERHEGQEVPLHAECGKAEHEAYDEGQRAAGEHPHHPGRPPQREQRRRVGADRHERGLRQRDLPGIAERQVQAHRRDAEDQPGAQRVDDVVALPKRRDDQRRQTQGAEQPLPRGHTCRPSEVPNNPYGTPQDDRDQQHERHRGAILRRDVGRDQVVEHAQQQPPGDRAADLVEAADDGRDERDEPELLPVGELHQEHGRDQEAGQRRQGPR